MKKLILSVFVLVASFNSVKANNTSVNNVKSVTSINDMGTFFKLIQQGNYDVVKAMIESGESIDKKSNGLTPLMFAARYNQVKIAKLLIEKGADLQIKSDKGGFTALQWAKMTKANETFSIIKSAMKM